MFIFYVEVFIKLLLGLVMASLIIKATGKTTLSPQSPIDQIQNYILGGIIGGTIYSRDITIIMFLIVMLIWFCIAFVFYYMRKKSPEISNLLDGKSIRILENGLINKSKLRESNLTINELYSMMRTQGIGSITQIELGIIEKNGNLSIISKESVEKTYLIISDGVINKEEVKRLGINDSKLSILLCSENIISVESVSILELDELLNVIFLQLDDK